MPHPTSPSEAVGSESRPLHEEQNLRRAIEERRRRGQELAPALIWLTGAASYWESKFHPEPFWKENADCSHCHGFGNVDGVSCTCAAGEKWTQHRWFVDNNPEFCKAPETPPEVSDVRFTLTDDLEEITTVTAGGSTLELTKSLAKWMEWGYVYRLKWRGVDVFEVITRCDIIHSEELNDSFDSEEVESVERFAPGEWVMLLEGMYAWEQLRSQRAMESIEADRLDDERSRWGL